MKTVRLLTLTSLFAASTALAHTMNVLPSHYVQSKTGGFVTVDLFASNMTFQADKGVGVEGFKVVVPDGSIAKPTAAVQGKRKSIADVELAVAGTYRLEMGGQPRYFTSYKVGGEQKRLMGDKQKAAKELPKDATDVVTTQGRNAMLDVFLGRGSAYAANYFGLITSGTPVVGEVDVNVGRVDALGVQEPLEEEAVADGIDPGDAERVVDEAARPGAAGRAADA